MTRSAWAAAIILALACAPAVRSADQVVVVDGGRALVTGIYIDAALDEHSPVRFAAADLAQAIQRMSGVTVEVKAVADAAAVPQGPAIVLGRLANRLGISPAAQTPWQDTMRTVVGDNRIFVAGESDTAVNAAVMDLLHEQGVRYLLPANIPGDIGTIMPARPTLAWTQRDHERHPHVRARRIWGHNVGSGDWPHAHATIRWVRRNAGLSPVQINVSHAWDGLLSAEVKKADPQLMAIKRYDEQGNPVRGGQFCVSNPRVTELVAETLATRFGDDAALVSQSVSPNDGGGQCVCQACQRLDVAGYVEPSSGRPAVSDRYVWFFNRLAERLESRFPDRYLAHFVYSDYSRALRRESRLHPMLLPVFAPIRYCRIHSMFSPVCEQNVRQRNTVERYTATARQVGYYGYNYNLAETIVPFSKLTTWAQDLPWLANKNLVYVSLETLGNWNSNAPHIYLGTRYIYSGEDPQAITADYFDKLGGAAASDLRAYWQAVDQTWMSADIHSGSFYGVEQVLNPQVCSELQTHLDRAARAAADEREKAVVALFQSGLDMGRLTVEMIGHLNAARFAQARDLRDRLASISTELEKQKIVSIYPNRYRTWFIDHVVDSGAAIIESGGQVKQTLPDTWLFRHDPYDVGVEEEWFDPSHGDGRWLNARMWGHPSLYSQGLGDFVGYQWAKVTVPVPAEEADRLVLWFGANDGRTRLWINGKAVPFMVENKPAGKQPAVKAPVIEYPKAWRSFSVPVGSFLRPGQDNTFVVRIDHQLNDMNLGGMLRPVVLYLPGPQETKEIQDSYRRIDM